MICSVETQRTREEVAILSNKTKETKPIVVNHVTVRYGNRLMENFLPMRLWFGEIFYLPKNMIIEFNREAIEFNRTQSKGNRTQSKAIERNQSFSIFY